ncbi:unnamed protein product, partial [Iphiclides podalirius]
MPGARSARARAPLTSATARRRAALVTTVAGQLLFSTHGQERRETKGDGGGGARAERARRRSDARRHLAGHAATTRAYSFRVCGRSNRDGTAATPEPHWRRKHCHCTVVTRGAPAAGCCRGATRCVWCVERVVPSSERGCVSWWRSGGPCCQAARERRGPGMAGSCSTLRCGRPRRALHATGPRTARARLRRRCARTPALGDTAAPRLRRSAAGLQPRAPAPHRPHNTTRATYRLSPPLAPALFEKGRCDALQRAQKWSQLNPLTRSGHC